MLGRRLLEAEAQEPAERERIGGAPRDAALRVDALEVPDQQQPEVRARRQARATHCRGVEWGALRLNKRVERVGVEDLIQPLVEGMPARDGQLIRRDPQPRCPCPILTSTHGHAGHTTRVDPFWRMIYSDSLLTTGC